jgi:hypothetical protein
MKMTMAMKRREGENEEEAGDAGGVLRASGADAGGIENCVRGLRRVLTAVEWGVDVHMAVREPPLAGRARRRHLAPFRAMPGSVANDWSKMGDRDVFGYINVMQGEVLGEWDVIHQEGHVCREAGNR